MPAIGTNYTEQVIPCRVAGERAEFCSGRERHTGKSINLTAWVCPTLDTPKGFATDGAEHPAGREAFELPILAAVGTADRRNVRPSRQRRSARRAQRTSL